MNCENIEKLMSPKSVAVVGVTDKPGSFGRACAINVMKSSIKDHVYYVHPKREELYGVQCYQDLSMLPETVELVIVCTPAATVNPILRQAAQLGIKAAIVYASGFSEEGTPEGIALENEMVDIANKYDMAVCGPNNIGIINNIDKINLCGLGADFDMEKRKPGIAVLAQSGFIAMNIINKQYFNISYAVSTGNGNVFTLEDSLEYLVEKDEVKSCAIYLEGIKNAEVFSRALRKAAEKKKPIVVLKSGTSQKGAQSAASHTGNLAGSSQAYDAVFKKFGVIQVDSLEELLCTAQMYSVLDGKFPKVSGFAGINFSGGENTLCADLCERYGVELPDLREETTTEMKKYIPSFATAKNPLDGTTALFTSEEKVYNLLRVLSEDGKIGGITVGMSLGGKETISPKEQTSAKAMMRIAEENQDIALFAVPSYEGERNPQWRTQLESHRISVLSSAEIAYKVLGKLGKFINYDHSKVLLETAACKLSKKGKKSTALSEYDSKQQIQACGVPVPAQAIARSKEELIETLKTMTYPVVLKINSQDILHKTEAGGVKLNIKTEAEAVKACEDILKSCKAYAPEARTDGILVQEMAKAGTEIIIGVKNDAQFGPMILVGLGGIFVEIFKDVALLPCPVNKYEAMSMIKGLKAYKLLSGYRGSKPCDIDALADLIVKISDYAQKNRENLLEMDLNPVFVYEEGSGVMVVDSLIVNCENE